MMNAWCQRCGGTGDDFDPGVRDWKFPREDCQACLGTGDGDVENADSWTMAEEIIELKMSLIRRRHA